MIIDTDVGVLTTAGRPVYDADFHVSTSSPHFSAMMPTERWTKKANAFATAWFQKYGRLVPTAALCEACAVAQHETLCGDAWPGEFNWGAVQLRGLTFGEKAVLTHVEPSPKNVAGARVALANAVAANAIPAEPNGALHVDSSPGKGWYWVYFHKFENDIAGARFFIHVLCDQRPRCLETLQSAGGNWEVECSDLAERMYETHYYEGFYIPTKMYGTKSGATMNVEAYASSIEAIAPTIASAIGLPWVPKLTLDLNGSSDVQAALTFLAIMLRHPEFNPLGIDGVWGPHSKAALEAFQMFALPTSSATLGMPNAQTAVALQSAIDTVLRA